MAPSCSRCNKSITSVHLPVLCSLCLKNYHAPCVNLTANEVNYFNETNEQWVCPLCPKQGRVTRSNSTSTTRSDSASNQQPNSLNTSDHQLSSIMDKLLSIANDVKDIKESQARLSADVVQCKSLLEKHSEILLRHDSSILACESNIVQLQNAHTKVSSDLATIGSKINNLESRMSTATVTQTPSLNETLPLNETMERFKRSHNIIIQKLPEVDEAEDTSQVANIIALIEPSANNHRIGMTRLGATNPSCPRPIKNEAL
nr:unnamed protein product [Callosobruchus analis]